MSAGSSIKPSDLREWEGGTLYVRNNSVARIVHDDTGTHAMYGGELTLGHAGSSDCVGVLPLPVAKHPGFQKIWRKGDVTVSTDPAMEDELFLMEQRQNEIAVKKAEELSSHMEDNPADKDMVESICVHCGTKIFIPEIQKKQNTTPPLCEDHKKLSSIFNLQNFQNKKTGVPEQRWVSTVTKTTPNKS